MCVISEHITRLETPNFDLGWDPHWENVLIIDMSILTPEMDLINYTEAIGKKKIFKFMFKIFPTRKNIFWTRVDQIQMVRQSTSRYVYVRVRLGYIYGTISG